MSYIPQTPETEKAFTEGILRGKIHSTPSPETKQLFKNFNMEIEFIKEKLEQMPTKAEMELANEKLIERLDKRYAGKLVEKIVFGLVLLMILGIVGFLGQMIISYIRTAP